MKWTAQLFAVVAGTCVCMSTAAAHISLMEPAARYDGSLAGQSKACPCGVGDSNRLCDVDGDRSDPDRSANVTTLEAGSTVTFVFDEYVAHAGRYRIAFDPDGADLTDFNANVLLDVPDPAGNDGNVNNGSIWELEVTVPDMPCNNCTLQLIQMMDGNVDDPVDDPVGRSSYYQCADIVIVPAGADVGVPDTGAPDVGVADVGVPDTGPQNNTPLPTPDFGMPPNPGVDTGVTPTSDTGGNGTPASVDGTGSACTSTGPMPAGSTAWPLLLGVIIGTIRRRSRR